MNRLLALIALLFAFSAVAGPALAAGGVLAKSGAPGMVLDDQFEVCMEAEPNGTGLVFRLCPKTVKSGLATFCHQCLAVLPGTGIDVGGRAVGQAVDHANDLATTQSSVRRQFRPPRHFGNA